MKDAQMIVPFTHRARDIRRRKGGRARARITNPHRSDGVLTLAPGVTPRRTSDMSAIDGRTRMDESIAAVVRATVAETLGVEPGDIADDDLLLGLPSCDSLRLLQIVVRIEERTNAELHEENLLMARTVGDLVKLVQGVPI
jgi:acyl carrier protein